MPSPPQTVRSERTRAALREAALNRFRSQGLEATTAEQVAQDAGVTLRTFYRHFGSLKDLLFADYDSGLQWFRAALRGRPHGEPVTASVRASVFAFPYDMGAVSELARLRAYELDPEQLVAHLRRVEGDVAAAIREHMRAALADTATDIDIAVTARCLAAALFAAMDVWLARDHRTLADLATLSNAALDAVERGLDGRGIFCHS